MLKRGHAGRESREINFTCVCSVRIDLGELEDSITVNVGGEMLGSEMCIEERLVGES
jgi:hypothetical protein